MPHTPSQGRASSATSRASEAPPPAQRKSPVSVPVMAVIMAAMLVSTGASVAGGIYVYIRALRTMEKNVREASTATLADLDYRLEDVVLAPLEETDLLADVLLGASSQCGLSDPTIMLLCSASLRLRPSYGIGLALLPHASDPAGVAYMAMWRDRMANATYSWTWAVTTPPDPACATNCSAAATAYRYDPHDPVVYDASAPVYDFAVGFYQRLLDGYDGTRLPHTHGWEERIEEYTHPHRILTQRILGRRHREMMSWYAPDNTPYRYAGWDSVYAPPPPPHPWSGYAAIDVFAHYELAAWDEVLATRANVSADEVIVVLDGAGRDVMTTTLRGLAADSACADSIKKQQADTFSVSCARSLSDTPAFIQDGYAVARAAEERLVGDDNPDAQVVFIVARAGGAGYFIAKQRMITGYQILWMRPTSSVEAEVRNALYFSMVLFSLLVFCVDVLLAVFEIRFVGLPLKELAKVVHCISDLDTQEALSMLHPQFATPVAVREVFQLAEGIAVVAHNLREFKSYLPESTLMPLRHLHDEVVDATDAALLSKSRPNTANTMDSRVSLEDNFPVSSPLHVDSNRHPSEASLASYAMLNLQPKLQKKTFSVVMVNTRGFHLRVQTAAKPRAYALTFLSEVLAVVLVTVRGNSGMLESFTGDRMLASFNASRVNVNHGINAPSCALNIRDAMAGAGIAMVCAVASGDGLLGATGTVEMRSYSIISPAIPYASKLLLCSAALRTSVLVSHVSKRRMGDGFVSRIVLGVRFSMLGYADDTLLQSMRKDQVKNDDDNGKPVYLVHELLSRQSDSYQGLEWMYELAQNEARWDNVWDIWAAAVINEEWDVAAQRAATVPVPDTPSVAYTILTASALTRSYKPIELDLPFDFHGHIQADECVMSVTPSPRDGSHSAPSTFASRGRSPDFDVQSAGSSRSQGATNKWAARVDSMDNPLQCSSMGSRPSSS